jgi:hypothetical protein
MSKPATNHCHVHLCRDKTHGRGVPEPVWGYSLADQGGDLLARRGGILFQLEADPGGFEGISIPVHEDGFIFPPRFSFQESFQQFNSLGPKRADSLFSAFGGHGQLQLMPPGRVKPSGSRIHTTRCLEGSTSSSRTAMAGGAIASISTTTQVGCGRSLPVGPTLSRTIRLWWWPLAGPRSVWPTCSRSPT